MGIAVQSGWASDIQKFAVQYKMHYTILVGNDDTVSELWHNQLSHDLRYWSRLEVVQEVFRLSREQERADIERDIEALLKAKPVL